MLSPQGAVRAQTVSSFEGDRGPGAAVCKADGAPIHCDRAEMDVAASGKQVVQVTWQNVNVYDSDGQAAEIDAAFHGHPRRRTRSEPGERRRTVRAAHRL